MTKVSKIIFIFIILTIICPVFFVPGCSSEVGLYLPEEDSGYYIADYNVDIVVGKDKSLVIAESITAHFVTEPSNGIYRYIPLEQTVGYYDLNGKLQQKNYRSSISNFSNTNSSFLIQNYQENGYQFYALKRRGSLDANREYTFDFSYKYSMPDDRHGRLDFLYYNIIGSGWDTSIKNVTFSVEFPQDADIESINPEFYVGRYGNASSDSRLTYSISGNVVSGSCVNLNYGEAITIYRGFENGYFKVSRTFVWDFVLLGLFIACAIGAGLLIVKFKSKNPIVEVVEFKPPEGLSPTEAGFIIDGRVTGEDISALVVYWASKGYVKIQKQGEEIFAIKKSPLPDDVRQHEKLFFNDLFKESDTVNVSKMSGLSESIGQKVKTSVENKEALYFNKKSHKWTLVCVVMSLLLLALSAYKSCMQSVDTFLMIIKWGLILLSGLGFAWSLTIYQQKYKFNKGVYYTCYAIALILVVAPLIANMFIGESYCDPFGSRIWLALIPIILLFAYPFLERHTNKGREIMGRLLGLRNFMMVAEKDRMETLAKETPEIFFDILPFAYVLGVSEVFMEKIKDIPIISPEWISGDFVETWVMINLLNRSVGNLGMNINRNMPTMLKSLGKIASSTSRSSGGGSFGGGGGFSGGGFGGGGGGRF